MKKKIFALILAVFFTFSLAGCSSDFLTDAQIERFIGNAENPTVEIVFEYENNNSEARRVTLEYELLYRQTPSTVANFVQLATAGYYENKVFHRATASNDAALVGSDVPYIAGGKYFIEEDGSYKEDKKNYCIKGEFISNGWYEENEAGDKVPKNDPKCELVKHQLGSLVMYRDSGVDKAFDTASTVFYISLSDPIGSNSRQGNYAVFGQLIGFKAEAKDGGAWVAIGSTVLTPGLPKWFVSEMLNVEKTYQTTTEDRSIQVPKNPLTIKSVTVDQKDKDYSKARVAKIYGAKVEED